MIDVYFKYVIVLIIRLSRTHLSYFSLTNTHYSRLHTRTRNGTRLPFFECCCLFVSYLVVPKYTYIGILKYYYSANVIGLQTVWLWIFHRWLLLFVGGFYQQINHVKFVLGLLLLLLMFTMYIHYALSHSKLLAYALLLEIWEIFRCLLLVLHVKIVPELDVNQLQILCVKMS